MSYCEACEELRKHAPNFLVNGITDTECNSLQNNTGLNPALTVLHDNCEDLNNMLDCLIGQHADKLSAYDVCEIKDYIKELMNNIYNMYKALICSDCGQWEALENTSYAGSSTLWTTVSAAESGEGDLSPAFNRFTQESNLPDGVITHSGFKRIIINNTTGVPLLVNSTFNCSIGSDQLLAAAYIVVTRDGKRIGQAPFIAPNSYDQQVTGESFILNPGQRATLGYYMRVGVQNEYFIPIFGGTGNISCVLDVDAPNNPAAQRSYFNVYVTSIVGKKSSTE